MPNSIDHVSHVVFCVRPEQMDEVRQFWSALDVELEEFVREDYGLRILYGWNTGVEIITSVGTTGGFVEAVSTHLATHGPGIYSVVYGVASLAMAAEQVRAAGADVDIFPESMNGNEPWFHRYEYLREGLVLGHDTLRLSLVEKRHADHSENASGAVSHVIYTLDPKSLAPARAFLKSALNVEFEDVDTKNPNLEVLYSQDAGLELLGPAPGSKGFLAEGLRQQGEGPLLVAFKVPDIEVAAGKAEAHTGVGPTARISYTGLPGWSDKYEVLEEVILEPVCGLRVALAQIDLVE